MKRTMLGAVAILIAIVQPAWSGDSVLVMALEPRQVPVAVKIDVDAAYVMAPVVMECDERDAAKKAAKMVSATRRLIEHGATKHGIEIRQGVVSLATGQQDSFAVSKSYGGGATSNLFLVATLGDKEDIYAASVRMAEFVGTVPKMDCVSMRSGTAVLAVDNPERFRPQLLKLVADQAERSKSALRIGREVEVGGLEHPVLAIQKNAREISLNINYSIKIRQ